MTAAKPPKRNVSGPIAEAATVAAIGAWTALTFHPRDTLLVVAAAAAAHAYSRRPRR